MGTLRILFLGDVVGEPGLRAVQARLHRLVAETGAGLVVANGENTAAGLGITGATARALFSAGVHVITTGNHVWDKKEILGRLEHLPRLLRPANYPPGTPGVGWCTVEAGGVPVGVANLSGRIFMDPLDCPFQVADAVFARFPPEVRVRLLDFHAEATSEKQAMGWHLDGRVTAVLGTHTHVATADARVLPGGTGYITDVGMSGVRDSVIGVSAGRAVERFRSRIPRGHAVAEGEATVCGVVVSADTASGRCTGIERVESGPPGS
ncbi:MAG: TIGR00282 family metallophosphoesterase [Deferrisomatales bacterium]|nr:TIGR00282 family metallophosphoesterase [Deferrisomatales bacterium]